MIDVFISYVHEDKDYREEIEKFLVMLCRQKLINIWTDREIIPGSEWNAEIRNHFQESKVILLLISQDFLYSDFCYEKEMKWAFEKHLNNEADIIPIILRPCDWQNTPIKDLQVLPSGGKPVTLWDNKDLAYLEITQGISAVISKMKNKEHISEPLMILGPAKAIYTGERIEGSPYIKNCRTYMSVKYVAQKVGVKNENIIWDETNNVLTMLKDDIVVQVKVDSTKLIINGTIITLDVETECLDGEVMLPPIYIAQAFGFNVYYDNALGTLMIENWN